MKILFAFLVLIATVGCNTQRLDQTTTTIVDGVPTTKTTKFRSGSLFNNSSTKGLAVDSITGKTSYGLKITGQTQEVSDEGIRATFEGAGAAFGAGLKAAAGQ